uniref:G-protein coupled receptors family 1 profile domain-containing protein n=1 Tax=Chelonoidis abingdonii TaxID=106734 RepID=A0A8C0GQ98_CHEAB
LNHSQEDTSLGDGLLLWSFVQGLFFGLFLCLYTAIVMVLPKMMKNLIQEEKTISFDGCMAQLFAFTLSGGTELVLLSAISYDWYVAICHPLRYVNLMTKRICINLTIGVWAVSITNSLVHTLLMLRLDFCGSKLIQHFFCEIPPLLALSWMSYSFIIITILKIQSFKGKQRAFSTCSSHLLVVTLFYSSIIYTYIRPTSSDSLTKDKITAIMYTLVIPTMNPLIYTLLNKEVKVAFGKILSIRKKS